MCDIKTRPPTLGQLVGFAAYMGVVGYGGPAILALTKKSIVNDRRWVSEEEFLNALGLSQMLPGAIAVTLFGYLGYKCKGFMGGVLTPLAFAFPAFAIMIVLAWAYFTYGEAPLVRSVFTGLGGLVVALLVNAVVVMAETAFRGSARDIPKGICIAVVSFCGMLFLDIDIFMIIIFSGLIGILFFHVSIGGEYSGQCDTNQADVAYAWKSGDTVLLVFIMVFFGAFFWFVNEIWSIYWTFFRISLFAFGGGYTAIPLIQHTIVDGKQWLDLTAFRDGIALGQVTPGPVFITAAFIGYKVKGVLGAVFATLGVFTPSLSTIMLLARLHEKIKHFGIIRAVMRGLVCGFIGLLLVVVLRFGAQSLVSFQTWLIFGLSGFYLFWLKKNMIWLVLGTIAVSFFMF